LTPYCAGAPRPVSPGSIPRFTPTQLADQRMKQSIQIVDRCAQVLLWYRADRRASVFFKHARHVQQQPHD